MKNKLFSVIMIALLAGQVAWAQETIGNIQYNSTEGYYEIDDAQDLRDLAEYVNGDKEVPPHNCEGLIFMMTADIDFSPTSAWDDYTSDENNHTAIGRIETVDAFNSFNNSFNGIFDGQGHTISGIRINAGETSYQGIFGNVGSGGKVQNVTLANARIKGAFATGGIVGRNYCGTVQNCHAAHNVAVRVCINSISDVGGIVGDNNSSVSSVSECTSAAVITMDGGSENCRCFGGIVGYNGGTVSNCTAEGVIVPSYVDVDYCGAVVGRNHQGTLSGNTYHSSLMGTTYAFNIGVGGAVGARGDVDGVTINTQRFYLYTDRDNTNLLEAYAKAYNSDGSTAYGATRPKVGALNVTLKGYTFHKDGSWNTLSLPFPFTDFGIANSPLKDATVKELNEDNTVYDSSTGKLTVAFKTVTSIERTYPYIVKWNSGDDVSDPVFFNINVKNFSKTIGTTTAGLVKISGNSNKPFNLVDGILLDSHNLNNLSCHAAITLSAPAASGGYTFAGWNTAADGSGTDVTTTIPFGTNGSFSLYAQWFGSTPTLTGHLSDARYWATFYHKTLRFTLPEGATAYTMDVHLKLYRLGDDGRTIPANTAVVIISDSENITLTNSTDATSVTDHAPGGNILRGYNIPTSVTSANTLGIVDGKLGFYPYTGDTVPANKAFF